MPEPTLDKLRSNAEIFENSRVRFKANECPIHFSGCFTLFFRFEFSLRKSGLHKLAGAIASDEKSFGKSVDRLGSDTIQTNAELKNIVVVLRPSINLGDAFHHFTKRNAATEVAHRHHIFFHRDLHLASMA